MPPKEDILESNLYTAVRYFQRPILGLDILPYICGRVMGYGV